MRKSFHIRFGKSQRRSILAETLYHRACKLKLSCPLGRAIYLANRHANGDYKPWGGSSRTMAGFGTVRPGDHNPRDDRALKSVRLETARRWHLHWINGGSMKALRHTAKQWAARRKTSEAEIRARMVGL